MSDPVRPNISPWLATILRPIHNVFIPAFFGIRVKGADRLPSDGPILLTPTHRSRWDPVILPYITRRLLRSMASHDEFVGVQGWFMRKLGAFPVNTKRPSPGTLKACAEILKQGQILVIYPEGNLCYLPPDHVFPIKPGTAWIALKVQEHLPETPIRIYPVRIRYGKLYPGFRTKVEVEVMDPIAVTDYRDQPERQAIATLTATIQAGMGDVVDSDRLNTARGRAAAAAPQPVAPTDASARAAS